jgi:hypothetical protein
MIEGRIVNGTAGGNGVTDQGAILKTHLNDAEVGTASTTTDAEGHFVFNGLSTEVGYRYQVVLTFQDAEYYSDWLIFNDGETRKSIEMTVYDSTASDEAIRVAMAHTIIYVGQGSLEVMEYYLFVNQFDRTYIGSKEAAADETRQTLRFTLPEGATEFQNKLGLMDCCINGSEDGFVDTMPVFPGAREVAYSYEVSYTSGKYAFSQNMNYPISSYNFLVQGEGVKVASDRLTEGEPMDIEGIRFKHLSTQELAPGETLEAQISGLPQSERQGAMLWVVLTMLVVIGGFSFVYLMRRGRLQPVGPKDSLDQRRRRLLVEITQMDDNFEGGSIPEEAYRGQRANKMAQLVGLTQRLKKERGDR